MTRLLILVSRDVPIEQEGHSRCLTRPFFSPMGFSKGMLSGNARVTSDSDMTVAGMVKGDLIVEQGARVHVSGIVDGRIVNEGGDVTISGIISR